MPCLWGYVSLNLYVGKCFFRVCCSIVETMFSTTFGVGLETVMLSKTVYRISILGFLIIITNLVSYRHARVQTERRDIIQSALQKQTILSTTRIACGDCNSPLRWTIS